MRPVKSEFNRVKNAGPNVVFDNQSIDDDIDVVALILL